MQDFFHQQYHQISVQPRTGPVTGHSSLLATWKGVGKLHAVNGLFVSMWLSCGNEKNPPVTFNYLFFMAKFVVAFCNWWLIVIRDFLQKTIPWYIGILAIGLLQFRIPYIYKWVVQSDIWHKQPRFFFNAHVRLFLNLGRPVRGIIMNYHPTISGNVYTQNWGFPSLSFSCFVGMGIPLQNASSARTWNFWWFFWLDAPIHDFDLLKLVGKITNVFYSPNGVLNRDLSHGRK